MNTSNLSACEIATIIEEWSYTCPARSFAGLTLAQFKSILRETPQDQQKQFEGIAALWRRNARNPFFGGVYLSHGGKETVGGLE